MDLRMRRTPVPHIDGSPAGLPSARGPLSDYLIMHLRRAPHTLPEAPEPVDDPLSGDDAQLALYICYELFYQSFAGVDDGWEWEPSLLAFRQSLEAVFEERLLCEVGRPAGYTDAVAGLHQIIYEDDGPSLSRYLDERGTVEQFREFVVHRSAYQLKEADPHTWALPRLYGRPKSALVDIQFEEYGEGQESEMHASVFRDTLAHLGLDSRYGAYLDYLPGVTLATVNLMSLFGLHRRWRGAIVGHLALFEMTSTAPNTRYGDALRRLGFDAAVTKFYDVHVEADADHEVMAREDLVASLVEQEPQIAGDIIFGARALALTDGAWAQRLILCWESDRTSLLRPLAA
jgi:hypothetical protein